MADTANFNKGGIKTHQVSSKGLDKKSSLLVTTILSMDTMGVADECLINIR